MTSAWRYVTDANCVRHWHLYRNVGPAQRIHALLPACGRAAALALPLLAGPAVATLPARALAPMLPLIGQPDAFGRGAYALGGAGFGFGDAGYAPFGPGFGAGGYGYAGEGRSARVPGVPPVVGTAYAGLGISNSPGLNRVGTQAFPQADQVVSPGQMLEGNGGAAHAPNAPQPVPAPGGLAVIAVALAGVIIGRRRA